MSEKSLNFLKFLKTYWKTLVLFLTPIISLVVPLCWNTVSLQTALCAYVVIIMGVFWAAEVLPLPVTALLPLVAFPFMNIQSAMEVANSYVQDISFLFIGGLMFGIAIQEVMLHRRIAVKICLLVGSEPKMLLAGVMIATAFLSMWISNPAAASIMVPIVLSLLSELIRTQRAEIIESQHHPCGPFEDVVHHAMNPASEKRVEVSHQTLNKQEMSICKAMLLGVCFSASLGGTATLTGSPPNIIMTGLLTKHYGKSHPINFASWMAFSLPGVVINLVLAWCWLQILFLGVRSFFQCFTNHKKSSLKNSLMKQALKDQLANMGPVTFGEWSMIGWFVVLLILWLTRSYTWGKLWAMGRKPYITDGTCAIFVALCLFVWPRNRPFSEWRSGSTILKWDVVQRRLSWGVILLLGGAFALSSAVQTTGLSKVLSGILSQMTISNQALCLMSLLCMTFITELTCGAATSNIMVPIVMVLAESRCMNPLYLTLPVAQAASFAFMLPVATPPNAIVFAQGILRVTDMMMAGFAVNLICICEVLLSIHTWGWAMFELGEYPLWAAAIANATCI